MQKVAKWTNEFALPDAELHQDANLLYSYSHQHQGQIPTSADYVVGTYTCECIVRGSPLAMGGILAVGCLD